jgi:hypothetical protein
VGGDPVNYNDPPGLFRSAADSLVTLGGPAPKPSQALSGGGGGGGGAAADWHIPQLMIPPNFDLGNAQSNPSSGRTEISFHSAFHIASRAADRIATKNKWSRDCERLLAKLGTSGAAISEAASKVLFFEAPGSTVTMASLYANTALSPSAIGQYGNETIASYIQREPTKALGELNGNRVFINQAYWGFSFYDDMATVMHELVHNATTLTDPDISLRLKDDMHRYQESFSGLLKLKCF